MGFDVRYGDVIPKILGLLKSLSLCVIRQVKLAPNLLELVVNMRPGMKSPNSLRRDELITKAQ